MSNHIVTKASLIKMLEDDTKRIVVIGRACVALFERQTDDEQVANVTTESNFRGFSQSDARQGSLTAKYYIRHRTLADWMVEKWMKDWRGAPRIAKYWKQLDEVAKRKATEV